jgi:hypothetical protein
MMSIVVNKNNQVCIASDSVFEGVPSGVTFDPERRSLTLQFADGRQKRLGTSGMNDIYRTLHKVRFIRFMLLRQPEPTYNINLPLYIRMNAEEKTYATA